MQRNIHLIKVSKFVKASLSLFQGRKLKLCKRVMYDEKLKNLYSNTPKVALKLLEKRLVLPMALANKT